MQIAPTTTIFTHVGMAENISETGVLAMILKNDKREVYQMKRIVD